LDRGLTNDFFPEYELGPTAYSFDSVASNSMKSSNPNSGCRKVDLCKTLDTAALNPSANQGGIAVVYEVNPAVIKESRVRRLTPRECERLQGFPDDWTDCGFNSSRYKQMGNAVTVNVIAWIGSRLP
jgi:site-specific DNA-cytosine methylase